MHRVTGARRRFLENWGSGLQRHARARLPATRRSLAVPCTSFQPGALPSMQWHAAPAQGKHLQRPATHRAVLRPAVRAVHRRGASIFARPRHLPLPVRRHRGHVRSGPASSGCAREALVANCPAHGGMPFES